LHVHVVLKNTASANNTATKLINYDTTIFNGHPTTRLRRLFTYTAFIAGETFTKCCDQLPKNTQNNVIDEKENETSR